MKRSTYPWFFIVLLLFIMTACTSVGTSPAASSNVEPNAIPATSVVSDSGKADSADPATAPPVPAVDTLEEAAVGAVSDVAVASEVRGQGGGGGGGYYFGGAGGPFVETELTVTAALPEQADANVYRLPNPYEGQINAELTVATAQKLGVEGPLYYEWYPGLPIEGADDTMQLTYHIFDGQERVMGFTNGEAFYENYAITRDQYGLKPLPFAERARIAEQFAQERGLLEGSYEMVSGWGHEVQFRSQLDGLMVTWPVLIIQVMPSGEVGSVSVRPYGATELTESADLRSADSALQYVRDHLAEGQLWFNIIPANPDYYAQPFPEGVKTHWERTPQPGQTTSFTSWVQIFRAADGSMPPRIMTDRNIVLSADAQTLNEIADATADASGGNMRLTGVINGEPGSQTLELSAWEPVVGTSDLYLNGTSRILDNQAWLELPGGFSVKLNDAPSDLPADTPIGVHSSGMRTAEDGCGAILDWIYVDLFNPPYIEPQQIDDPYANVTGVTIDDIALVYHYLYPGEMMPSTYDVFSSEPNGHLVPIWRLAGTTNKGDMVEFFVPALNSVEMPE